MDLNTAVEQLRQLDVKPYLRKATHGGYICPHCGSGENGTHNTGAVKYYQQTGTASCHACRRKVDAIDLYQQETGLEFVEAVKALAAERGMTIDSTGSGWRNNSTAAEDFAEVEERTPARPSLLSDEKPQEAQQVNYSGYYRECMERLQQSAAAQAYLTGRGISLENALAHNVGFDPAADPAGAPAAAADAYKAHPAPRIIVPTAPAHYVGRSIDPNTPGSYAKMNNKGGKPGIFNRRALWEAETVFVVEGAFDALSLLEVGAAAIALNSTNNVGLLLEELKAKPTKATLLLALDNDAAGKKAQAELQDGLNQLNICNASADVCGGYKDANEHLTGNRAAFVEAVQRVQAAQGVRPDNTANYIDCLMSGEIDRFKEAGNKLTGFSNLDAQAGGLYSGLYVLAAISSLGKTTFALQLADQLAAAGHDTIIFSMEQSRLELVSKSIARYTAQANMQTTVNSLSIRRGYLPEQVLTAAEAYKAAVGDRLSIVEGNFNCTIGYIGQYVRNYIARTGTRPTIIIDYLQILQPAQDGQSKGSKKDEIDLAVTELKRISRELDLTVIVISSVNRANYQTEFAFESLKESGGIEFTADCVWGLQLLCLDEPLFAEDKKVQDKRKRIADAKAEMPRRIKFVCIKNRYGISNYSCAFDYYPQHDLFVPAADLPAPAPKKTGKKF